MLILWCEALAQQSSDRVLPFKPCRIVKELRLVCLCLFPPVYGSGSSTISGRVGFQYQVNK